MSALQYSCTDAADGEGPDGGGGDGGGGDGGGCGGGSGAAFVLPPGMHFVIPRYLRDCLQAVSAEQGYATESDVLGNRGQVGETPRCRQASVGHRYRVSHLTNRF